MVMLTSRTESNYGKIDISRSGVVPATAPTTWATGAIAFWIDKNAPSSDGQVLGSAVAATSFNVKPACGTQLQISYSFPFIAP